MHIHTVRGPDSVGAQPLGNGSEIHPRSQGRRRSREGIGHLVFAEDLQGDLGGVGDFLTVGADESEGRPRKIIQPNIGRGDPNRLVKRAETPHSGRRTIRHGGNIIIVGVEHSNAVGRQGLNEFPLSPGNVIPRTEFAHVCGPHIEDHADVWWGDGRQVRNITNTAGGHFRHQILGGFGATQRGIRVPDLVIERPGRGHSVAGKLQYGVHNILSGSFPGGTGDPNDGQPPRTQLVDDVPCQLRHALQHGGNRTIGIMLGGIGMMIHLGCGRHNHGRHPHRAGGQHAGRPLIHGGGRIVVTINLHPGQGDKQVPGRDLPGIKLHVSSNHLRARGVGKPAAHNGGDLIQPQRYHWSLPSSAARNSSRSSKWCVTPSISCPTS